MLFLKKKLEKDEEKEFILGNAGAASTDGKWHHIGIAKIHASW